MQNPLLKQIKIVVHTNSIGDHLKSLSLSEEQATTIASYLAQRGIALENIVAEGKGENSPIATTKTINLIGSLNKSI